MQRKTQNILLGALIFVSYLAHAPAQTDSATAKVQSAAELRDGQHDFDFEMGTWKIHLKKLLHPLTGSKTWAEFDGDTVTRKVWDGRAWLEQFETNGPTGRVEGMTLRLYNPQTHQWSLYWANGKDGILGQPMIGEFKNGRGEFYDQEPSGPDGKAIIVRYIWSNTTSDSPHFEQSFSDDGGRTWEANWITDQTRVKDESGSPKEGDPEAAKKRDGQHDFDFEFGSWKAHLRRLLHPMTGSNQWVELDGTSVVRKIWGGRANLGEFEVDSGATHIEGLSLRLYNPQTQQWSIYWSNSKDGGLGTPMVGQFKNGRGEFYDQELFNGAAIYVRFIFSDITQTSFRLEQAFSADGGKTWEPNWVVAFTRQKAANVTARSEDSSAGETQ